MTIFGITGQTGAGKTTVLQVLAEMNGELIDCDAVYREILQRDSQLKEDLCQEFGSLYNDLGEIDREKLAGIVFSDPEKLLKLNALTHPYVLKKVEEKIQEAKGKGKDFVGIDAISLIESGLNHRCDFVIAVVAETTRRIERIMARDNITREYAEIRAKAQKDQVFFEENSNVILENNFEHMEDFRQYVKNFFIKYNV